MPLLLLLAACHHERPWNVVVVMTDDQRQDSLWAMPTVTERLVDPGVVFRDARVTTPMCCPSRASLLSGGFLAKDTGVLTNEDPNGGAPRFDVDAPSLATRLQDRGYETALVGKYLNAFDEVSPSVPPGWTSFTGTVDDPAFDDWTMLVGSTKGHERRGHVVSGTEYLTDWEGGQAVSFVQSAQEPFFLYLATLAPHFPSTPAPEDADLYDDFVYRGAAWDEEDVSDKPAWVRDNAPPLGEDEIADMDERERDELRTLAAVDRSVGDLMDALDARGALDHTLVVFTSDNGSLWGEHRLYGKGVPYEPALRVPLVVVAPGLDAGEDDRPVAVNLDVAATILAVAGDDGPTEGLDLRTSSARDVLPIEGYSAEHPVWAGVIEGRWKYVAWGEGDEELYDLDADPDELQSLLAAPGDAPLDDLRALVSAGRGLAVPVDDLPVGQLGVGYEYRLPVVGGTPPYAFQADDLPAGLSVSSDGVVQGTPTAEGEHRLRVIVTDSSVSPWHGGPQRFVLDGEITVGSPVSVDADVDRDGKRAVVHVRTSGPADVAVRWAGEPDFDLGGRTTPTRTVDGEADVVLEPIPDREWFWQLVVAGRPREVHRAR